MNNTSNSTNEKNNNCTKMNNTSNSINDTDYTIKIPKKLIDNMDDNNKKAATIMNNDGIDKAIEFMFTHPTETNEQGKPRQMSYAEMRYYYG